MSLSPPLGGIDCRRLLCTFYHRDYGDDPNAALRVSASPFGDAARMALVTPPGPLFPSAQLRVA